MPTPTRERLTSQLRADAKTFQQVSSLNAVVASAWREEVEKGTAGWTDFEATGAESWPEGAGDADAPRGRSLPEWLGDYWLIAVAACLALVSLGLVLADGPVAAELTLLLVSLMILGAGHAVLRARRRQRASEEAARRAQREATLRSQVAEAEARHQRLATFAELAAQIAHEVRNPLASIVLNAELLRDEVHACEHASPEARRLATAVCAEAERLSELTHEYLAFARLPSPDPAPQALGDLVADVARFCRSEAGRAGVTLALEGPPDVQAVIDPRLIRQALLNLVRNSIDAMPMGGTATLRTGADAGCVFVDVIDSGGGVPEALAEAVFNPFVSTKPRGTGLGLSVARKIARDHGGDLVLLPSPRGAWFRLQLPPPVRRLGDRRPEPAASDADDRRDGCDVRLSCGPAGVASGPSC